MQGWSVREDGPSLFNTNGRHAEGRTALRPLRIWSRSSVSASASLSGATPPSPFLRQGLKPALRRSAPRRFPSGLPDSLPSARPCSVAISVPRTLCNHRPLVKRKAVFAMLTELVDVEIPSREEHFDMQSYSADSGSLNTGVHSVSAASSLHCRTQTDICSPSDSATFLAHQRSFSRREFHRPMGILFNSNSLQL